MEGAVTVPLLMVIVPRQFGHVLSDAVNGLASVWKTLLLPAIGAFVPVSLVSVAMFRAMGGGVFLELILTNPERLQILPDQVLQELARPFYQAAAVSAALQVIAGVFVALASHAAVAAQIRGETFTGAAAARMALNRYMTGLGATVVIVGVVGILVGLGVTVWLIPALSLGTPSLGTELVALLLLVVLVGPGVWAGVNASMTTAAVAVERLDVLTSIRRSMRLVRGRWWPTAGFLLLVGFFGAIAIELINLVALPLASVGSGGTPLLIAAVLGILAQGLLVAAIAALYTHWYVDLRARKEDLSTVTLC